METVTLYFKQGGSDKIYQADIVAQDEGFVVNFAFGRRGSTLSTGTKTQSPVSYEKAKAIYDKLVQEKMAKGYTRGAEGTPYQHTDKESKATGIHCQLLNPLEESQIEKLLNDPAYWLQEKFDGRRLLVRKAGTTITGINRQGLTVGLPDSIVASASNSAVDFLLDGEAIGDLLHAFDVLQLGADDLRSLAYEERHPRMVKLLESFSGPAIRLVETFFTPKEKREALERLKAANAEGVVFKSVRAAYTAGRPNTGGTQHKFKFHETASFVVGSVNARRSVSLLLNDGSQMVSAGNVTIPPNHEIPKAGQVVECRYLYAFKESGSVYQPVYLGPRDDIPADDCTTDQLKYKAGTDEPA